MIELPEALTLADQLNATIRNKRIAKVTTGHTPHKFAWYYGDPAQYSVLLDGKAIDKAVAFGGLVEIRAGDAVMLFGDDVSLRFHKKNESRPERHQFLVEFEDLSAISASVKMYGGVGCFRGGELDNRYYRVAREKPSPLSESFNEEYFSRLISAPDLQRLSAKAFLATEQRIPGIGNGVLQDILFKARVHPKKKVCAFTDEERRSLFQSIKTVFREMSRRGGRDMETDLFGRRGGYKTKMSKNTVGKPCPACGNIIAKESYLGGSIYFCAQCQKL